MAEHPLSTQTPLVTEPQQLAVPRGVPPKGSVTEHELTIGGEKLAYRANADWITLRKKEKPVAEIFFVHYAKKGGEEESRRRPVTFVFNGGPGAASAYLHVGALGPRRVAFGADGSLLPPPVRLVENETTWLRFTDLVFIDPVGTGFSRTIDEEPKADGKGSQAEPGKEKENEEFYQVNRDLESLGEFINKFLSKNHLWARPAFIAGESYGGFRVGKLARKLQETYGVGLNGAILISPALEFGLLNGSDYDVLMYSDLFPSLVAAAVHHGRSRVFPKGAPLESFLPQAEAFATNELARLLAAGGFMPERERDAICQRMADMAGLPEEWVKAKSGRIAHYQFTRKLLRDQKRVVGLYDATVTAIDPFPDRDLFEGGDPTLFAIDRVFNSGINSQLRETLKVDTERDYHLLSLKVNTAWKVDGPKHAFDGLVGATDDLRYAMSLNPHMKVFITHGIYDLVTPYFSSNRLASLMKLQPEQWPSLAIRHFKGGHMFYAWEESRAEFARAMEAFFNDATQA